MLPLVLGLNGTELSDKEEAFFKSADPWGFVLFARNCETPDQIRKLIEHVRSSVGREAPVFIDQEGGRVQRLRGLSWRDVPPPATFAALYRSDPIKARRAVQINSQLIARELSRLGITGNFSPVLDLCFPETHQAIADRTFGADIEGVSVLGRHVCDAHLQQGVLPVLKHIPGQGRALVDSHEEMPRVSASRDQLRTSDFVPFRSLNTMPAAMVAHVVYDSFDPHGPATLSGTVVREVIRGEIGYDGLLFTDDIAMNALSGPMYERAVKSLDAGCDVALFCAPDLVEMEKIASNVGGVSSDSARRAAGALSRLTSPLLLDEEGLTAELATLLNLQA